MVTCWEKADLLALVGDVYCIFVSFPCGIVGQVWYLIASCPGLTYYLLSLIRLISPDYQMENLAIKQLKIYNMRG